MVGIAELLVQPAAQSQNKPLTKRREFCGADPKHALRNLKDLKTSVDRINTLYYHSRALPHPWGSSFYIANREVSILESYAEITT